MPVHSQASELLEGTTSYAQGVVVFLASHPADDRTSFLVVGGTLSENCASHNPLGGVTVVVFTLALGAKWIRNAITLYKSKRRLYDVNSLVRVRTCEAEIIGVGIKSPAIVVVKEEPT